MQDTAVIQRIRRSEYGVFGLWTKDEVMLCHTLERPWLNNAEGISCIPAGTYKCLVERSGKFPYKHFRLYEVQDRVGILVHRGNWIIDSHGCILVGMLANTKGIEQSRKALDVLVEKFPNGLTLVIKD